jgi:hypothetical protein
MSWHFSRALEEEYSAASCLGGALSALWKSTPIAPDDLCSDKMKGTFHHSPFGTMYVPSTDQIGAELLMWFRAGFHAQTSVPQERKPASMETPAGYGWKWQGSFARFDHDSCLWKTRQHSLIGDWGVFSETWPQWGLMRDGECLALEILPPITNVKGRGLWPTPCHGTKRWGGTFQEVGGSLNKLRNTPTGRLHVNPDFWEDLMGWPIGWTGTAQLETDKIQEWRQRHGAS